MSTLTAQEPSHVQDSIIKICNCSSDLEALTCFNYNLAQFIPIEDKGDCQSLALLKGELLLSHEC